MHATISQREIPADPRKWESRKGCVNYPRAYKIFARPRNLDARTRPTPIKPVGRRRPSAMDNPEAAGLHRSPRRRCHEKCIAERVHTTRMRTDCVGPSTVSEICYPTCVRKQLIEITFGRIRAARVSPSRLSTRAEITSFRGKMERQGEMTRIS